MGKKRLLFMIDAKGKPPRQATKEVIEAKEMFVDAAKKITEENPEKSLLTKNEKSFMDLINRIDSNR